MTNPFATLPIDQKAIELHARTEVPGAAEYIIKESARKDFTRSKALGTGNSGNLREESRTGGTNVRQTDLKNKQEISGTRTRHMRPNQVEMDLKQEQKKVEEEEALHLRGILL